jgi:MYXO-CTERM domain-containing protein
MGSLNGTGGAVQSNVGGAVALTIGNGGAGGSYAGTLANGSGAVSLIKTGAGTQTLSGNNSYSGGTTVGAGTLVAANVHALGTGGLTINGAATTRLQAGLTGPVQLPSLTLAGGTAPTSTLDITNNNVIVHNGNLATLTAQVTSGLYNGGNGLWSGAGINSSTANDDANNAAGDKAVGIISNDDGGGGTLYSTWPTGADSGGAVAVTNTDVLLKYTYFGDADLNGSVDASTDYSLWASGFSSGGSLGGWLFGDFDYNGTVDSSTDYSLWATGFAASGVQGPLGVNVQPVPEPGALLLAAMGLAGVAAFARRRRK